MTWDVAKIDHLIGTAVSSGVVLFFIYRRFRHTFGRQLLRRGRLKLRLGLFAAAGAVLLAHALFSAAGALAGAAGLGIGAGLAVWAARHTRFQEEDGKLYYVPHTYTGMVVSALFLGRILYRFAARFSAGQSGLAGVAAGGFGSFSSASQNPATLSIFFVLAGYYAGYYYYLLRESGSLKGKKGPLPLETAAANGAGA
ncbi:MAG: hypothetical protein NTY45_11635 [Elusimicrobia bacterium]|nr:hypothetical protein [Elusimicrobiota bacterium]